jgi:hypothetical protein
MFGLLSLACLDSEQDIGPAVPEMSQASERANCEEMFGTAFRSEAEREFFRSNCSDWSATVESATSVTTPSSASETIVELPTTNSGGRPQSEPGTVNITPAPVVPPPTPVVREQNPSPPSALQPTGSGSGSGSNQPSAGPREQNTSPPASPDGGNQPTPTATRSPSTPVSGQPRQSTEDLCERGYRSAAERNEYRRNCQ